MMVFSPKDDYHPHPFHMQVPPEVQRKQTEFKNAFSLVKRNNNLLRAAKKPYRWNDQDMKLIYTLVLITKDQEKQHHNSMIEIHHQSLKH